MLPVRIALAALAILTVSLVAGCGGQAAKSADAAPAPAAQPAAPAFSDLVVSYDIVRGHQNVPQDQADKICVLNNRFLHNEGIVWRIRVMDPVTGQFLDDKALDKVEVKLADGQALKASYGGHPAKNSTDSYWTANLEIPESYPSGALNFTVNVAAKDGRNKVKSLTFAEAPTQLTILDGKVDKVASK